LVDKSNVRPLGITTFSNTIEGAGGTEESLEDKDGSNKKRKETNGTRLNSIMNTGT